MAKQLFNSLPEKITIHRLLGGLAADNTQPMQEEMQKSIQENWLRIENKIPGVKFNFDFWRVCQPVRSTYPACRAVIAARMQGKEYDEIMTAHIQQAYYEEARNPSDINVLTELAVILGLDLHRFRRDLSAVHTQQVLMDEIQLSRDLHADSLPSLVFRAGNSVWPVVIDYLDVAPMVELINMFLEMEE